jgi:hypothetical protein
LKCRHSRSKSLHLESHNFIAPLDFYSRALKGNDDVIRIGLLCELDDKYAYAWFAETIRDLPFVTSIEVHDRYRLPSIQRDTPLFIDTFARSQCLDAFLNNDQKLADTHDTHVFIERTNCWRIVVSFVGPSSDCLVLRLKHRATGPDMTLTILGTSFTLPIPESITIDDINLYPSDYSTSQHSRAFMPNARNNLVLQTSISSSNYVLHDIQLLDEEGGRYG